MREYHTKDLTGQKFGMLTVVGRDVGNDYITPSTGRVSPRWLCKCDCGNPQLRSVPAQQLRSGHTWNCGCKSTNKFKDLVGQKFGKLTVLERAEDYITPQNEREVQWRCKCDCGRECIVRGHSLRNGHTTSCGCAAIDASTKHGMHGTRLYNIYGHMIQRCYNPANKSFEDYGARGIYICDEWRGENGFINFMNWALANGYNDNLSIDRINNDGPYCPDNCRWTDARTQANNRRSSIYMTYNGETHTISDWSLIMNIPYATLHNRYINMGWTVEQCLETPVNYYIHNITNSNGETHSLEEWSQITGISHKTLYDRIFRFGWNIDKALTDPTDQNVRYITYDGVTMNCSDWDKARGFLPCTVSGRLNKGYSVEYALNSPVKTKDEIKPINAIYFVDDNGKPI